MRRRIASAARFSQYALPHRSPSKFHTSQCKDNQESKEAGFVRATGIVRRIDELGRVVIPKEIRRTLRIREGDPLGDLHRPGRRGHLEEVFAYR